jgi:branched-chain amino acid transport system ATP-binding protein
VTGGYGKVTVLRDVSLSVPRGGVAAILGANGAGKTSLLKVASGLLRPTEGSVRIDGQDVTKRPPERRARKGLCHVTDGRAIFRDLTVRENLELAIPPWIKSRDLEQVLTLFPRLGERMTQRAGRMSGGEQQMLALSRAFLSKPAVVLVDEVSMGLAPLVVDEMFVALKVLAAQGTALLLVEQYVHRALEMADVVYLLDQGEITFSGPPSSLDESTLMAAYLGIEGSVDA